MSNALAVKIEFKGLRGVGKTVLSDHLWAHFNRLGIPVTRGVEGTQDGEDSLFVNVSMDTIDIIRRLDKKGTTT